MPEITLPISGIKAEVRRAKGRDVIQASRVIDDKDNKYELGLSLIARVTKVDGAPMTFEDIQDLDQEDITALGEAMGTKDFPVPPGSTSSSSRCSPDGAAERSSQ
jgi:hypothetical protein